MSDTDGELAVDELVAYCQTQARLLRGRVETLDEEAATLLSEIDDELSDARSRLDEQSGVTPSPHGMGADEELADLDALEADLTEKQAVVEAKQTRRDAFEELAVGYLELADELQTDAPAPSPALQLVVQFEHDRNAPTHFDERVTLLEAATESDDSDT